MAWIAHLTANLKSGETEMFTQNINKFARISTVALTLFATGGCVGGLNDNFILKDWHKIDEDTTNRERRSDDETARADAESDRTLALTQRRDVLKRDVQELKYELGLIQEQIAMLTSRGVPQAKAQNVKSKAQALQSIQLQIADTLGDASGEAGFAEMQNKVKQLRLRIKNLKDDIAELIQTGGR